MNSKINVAVIGKSNHAARHIHLIKENPTINLEAVYYPKNVETSDLPLTKNFDDVLRCDAVVISSPTWTHVNYLKLLNDFPGYVLVEKPAVSNSDEISILKNWSNDRKSRTRINFNLLYSKVYQALQKIITANALGNLLFFDLHTSHGLAFKQEYRTGWRGRSDQTLGVMETVGVHYINMVQALFGPIANKEADKIWAAGSEGPADSVVIRFKMSNGIRVTLRHSYAAPYKINWFCMGTNGFWEYDGKTASLYGPRDSFDSDNRFTSPPLVETMTADHATIWKDSLGEAVNQFYEDVGKGKNFKPELLDLAVKSVEPIFMI